MMIKLNGVTYKGWRLYVTGAYVRDGIMPVSALSRWVVVVKYADEWYFSASDDVIHLGVMFNSQNPKGLLKATNAKEAKAEADKFLMKIAKLEAFA